LAIYDEGLGWRGQPHGVGVYYRHKDGIRVPFKYNNFGFRDEDVVEKPVGSPRVLILGDSFVESLEIEYDDIFHELLEETLKRQANAKSEVVAISSQGYSNAQELLAFRRYQDRVDADIVLLAFYSGNDFEDNLRKGFAYLDDSGDLQLSQNDESEVKRLVRKTKRWLYEHSHLVFQLKNSLESAMHLNLGDPSKESLDQGNEYKLSLTQQLVHRIRDEVEQTDARFGLILIPSRDEIVDKDTDRIDELSAFCKQQKIEYLDLTPSLAASDYFPTDIHLNASGHRIVSQCVYAFLTSSFAHELRRHDAID